MSSVGAAFSTAANYTYGGDIDVYGVYQIGEV